MSETAKTDCAFSHKDARTISSITERALEKITALSLSLALKVERKFPNTNYGLWRHDHMQHAVRSSDELACQAK